MIILVVEYKYIYVKYVVMKMKYDFQDLLNSVEQKFTNNNTLFDPYITHIRFPH